MSAGILLEVIRNAISSTRRVRTTLLITVIASILTFFSAFNNLEFGWYRTRPVNYSKCQIWCPGINANPNSIPDRIGKDAEKKLYMWCENFMRENNIDCESIGNLASDMAKRRNDSLTVKVPWLGIHFDINDLGLVSGIFLIVIMLALNYSLVLKHQNLGKALSMIRSLEKVDERKKYFEVLSTAQVLSLPKESKGIELPLVLKVIPRILFALPSLAHGFVFINDLITAGDVFDFNPVYIIIAIVITGIFFLSIVSQTVACYKIDYQTDKLWEGFNSNK